MFRTILLQSLIDSLVLVLLASLTNLTQALTSLALLTQPKGSKHGPRICSLRQNRCISIFGVCSQTERKTRSLNRSEYELIPEDGHEPSYWAKTALLQPTK